MSRPRISVIIPVRDRAGLRLDNCLTSLRWQQGVDPSLVEIVLSDFGSTGSRIRAVAQAADAHRAILVRTETAETWNRSKALNIGIQSAAADLVLCTDVDMIFRDNFIATILRRLERAGRDSMVVCRCLDLPRMDPVRLHDASEFASLEQRSTVRSTTGTGACQATHADWLRMVRGYDEKYVFWGFEDKDMQSRALRAGLVLVWIHDETSMLHQWHERTQAARPLLKQINKWRYYLTRGIVIKNRNGWGTEASPRQHA